MPQWTILAGIVSLVSFWLEEGRGFALSLVRRVPVSVEGNGQHYYGCLVRLPRFREVENLLRRPLKCSMPTFLLENVGVPAHFCLNNSILKHLSGRVNWLI